MAEDALALVLYGYEKDGRKIPVPSTPSSFALSGNAFVNYIACSMGINFSQVLQEALLQKIQLK